MMWKDFIESEQKEEYFKQLNKFLDNEYKYQTVYPKQSDIYNAFGLELKNIKVVILGQDPYHNPNQAQGLAFSSDVIPPSLRNIFKELEDDYGYPIPEHGNLHSWVEEGVFLLNTVLTVRENQPNSHADQGWEVFTDNVIKYISDHTDNTVFILWGRNARTKKKLISDNHFIIESAHPSPLSAYRGFFGSKPFSKCNDYLVKIGKKPVNWQIKNIDLFNQI